MPQWPADGELPAPGDAAFDALLDRAPLPEDTTARLHQLAAALGELYAAPVEGTAAAERHAMAAFRVTAGQPEQAVAARSRPAQSRPARRPVRRRPAQRRARRPRLSARMAAIGAAAVVALGGAAAAAAYTGAVPDLLHRLTPHHPAAPSATAPGSPAQPATESRSAAPGTGRVWCAAYQDALAHGGPSAQRRALRNLVAAAGGAGNVTSYCAGVVQPQPTPGGQHTHPTHPPHPTHPAHPAYPAHPTHPPQPSPGPN